MEWLWERATTFAEIPTDVSETPFPYEEWVFIAQHQPGLTLRSYETLRQQAKIKPEQIIDQSSEERSSHRLYRWYHYQQFSEITKALVDVVFGDSTSGSGEEPFILTEDHPLVEPCIMYDTVMGNVAQVATIGQGIGMWIQGVDPDLYFIDNLPYYRQVAERLYHGLLPPQIKDTSYEDFYETAQYYTDAELLELFVPDTYLPFAYRPDLIRYCWTVFQERNN